VSETCRVIINQVKQKLHLVGYLLTRYLVSPLCQGSSRALTCLLVSQVFFPEGKAEVKNEWCYTSTPSIRLHGMHKHKLSFTLKIKYGFHRENK